MLSKDIKILTASIAESPNYYEVKWKEMKWNKEKISEENECVCCPASKKRIFADAN